jgi:cytochrome b
VRGPRRCGYLRSLPGPKPSTTVGHNPAGALAIVGLLALAAG